MQREEKDNSSSIKEQKRMWSRGVGLAEDEMEAKKKLQRIKSLTAKTENSVCSICSRRARDTRRAPPKDRTREQKKSHNSSELQNRLIRQNLWRTRNRLDFSGAEELLCIHPHGKESRMKELLPFIRSVLLIDNGRWHFRSNSSQ